MVLLSTRLIMANRFFEGAAHAAAYAKFRPQPPTSLIGRIVSFLKEGYSGTLDVAADVGCGTGQSTEVLTPYFENVTGLDISAAQVSEAAKLSLSNPKICFKVSGAEALPFKENSVQLVTASQACHWFDMPAFYKEVDRILVPGGVLALYGYLFPRPVHKHHSEELYGLLDHVYKVETEGCWGSARKDVDEAYSDDRFVIPYPGIVRDETHYVDKMMSVSDITGYLTSWSGFQNFKEKNGELAAQKILDDFQNGFMKLLDVSTAPEDTQVCMRLQFFLLMGRKPSM
ncbi:putative methyltransferase DDB_G0268948 isoform X1 [Macrobrachium nipponense]|uniref:putative methyltransferase DDB_G0268948 isoform X1 n=2 Tax=Macrobrachium nipponense TaxID=159736 RepID=UPI0030C8ADB8